MQQLAAAEGRPPACSNPSALGFSPLGNHVPPASLQRRSPCGRDLFRVQSLFGPGSGDSRKLRFGGERLSLEPGSSASAGGAAGRLVHQGSIRPCLTRARSASAQAQPGDFFRRQTGEPQGAGHCYRCFSAAPSPHHPDALLIAAWGNVGHVGLNTIAASPHVQGAPERGRADAIGPWLVANGVPAANVFLLPCVVNRQLPHLIKQADVAVFASRCEGGHESDGDGDLGLWCAHHDQRQYRTPGFIGHGLWPCLADGSGGARPRCS